VRSRWQVAVLPRHPRASAELEREARDGGVAVARAAGRAGPHARPDGGAWHWDDRLGVLPDYYAVADAAFVGGSLLPYGGHNPLEAAACGAAVLMGPHFESQRPAVTALAAREGLRIAGEPRELAAALAEILGDPAAAGRLGAAARAAADELRGAARRALGLLAAWRLWPVA